MDKDARHLKLEELATEGLRRAQAAAWKRAKETGTPFIVWRDGKVVDLNANPASYDVEIEELESLRLREEPED